MRKQLIAVIPVSLLLISGCAYFNTFYNAKQAYKKGQEEMAEQQGRQGNTAAGKEKYNRAIEKCQKVIDLYPTSRYVDDALLLMGKSYYYTKQYLPSLRRLGHLIRLYPQSTLVGEAALFRARNYLALEQLDSAQITLDRLQSQVVGTELGAEALLIRAELAERTQDFQGAVGFYEQALDNGIRQNRYVTYLAVAAIHDTLGQYEKSAIIFDLGTGSLVNRNRVHLK